MFMTIIPLIGVRIFSLMFDPKHFIFNETFNFYISKYLYFACTSFVMGKVRKTFLGLNIMVRGFYK